MSIAQTISHFHIRWIGRDMSDYKMMCLVLVMPLITVSGWVYGPEFFFVDPYHLDLFYQTLRSIA